MQLDTLKNSIATLQKLRDAHYSQLDAGALEELDGVLRQLRDASEGSKKQGLEHGNPVSRALLVVDIIVRAVSNITDWMK